MNEINNFKEQRLSAWCAHQSHLCNLIHTLTSKPYPQRVDQSLWLRVHRHKARRYLNLHGRFYKQPRVRVVTVEGNNEAQSRNPQTGLRCLTRL